MCPALSLNDSHALFFLRGIRKQEKRNHGFVQYVSLGSHHAAVRSAVWQLGIRKILTGTQGARDDQCWKTGRALRVVFVLCPSQWVDVLQDLQGLALGQLDERVATVHGRIAVV